MMASTTDQGVRVTSTSSPLLRLAAAALVGLAALSLQGCGRKGDPELPTVEKQRADRPVGIPMGALTPPPKPAEAPKQKTPFLLDPLL